MYFNVPTPCSNYCVYYRIIVQVRTVKRLRITSKILARKNDFNTEFLLAIAFFRSFAPTRSVR